MSRQNAPTNVEKFVRMHLSQIATEPYAPPAPARSSLERPSRATAAADGLSRKMSFGVFGAFGAFGRGAVVFVCGMAVGYVLSDQLEVFPLQAKTPDRGVGAAGLRIDYDLRHP
jgi:hypothetical protein